MATSTINQRGYHPHAMAWDTVPISETPNSGFTPRFRSKALNDAVARHSQANTKKAASDATPATGTPADKTKPPASRAAGRKGTLITKWKPRPFPKPNPDDYVMVVKPRECISLHEAFSENWYGTAFKAYVWHERAECLTVLPSREQNLIVIHTPPGPRHGGQVYRGLRGEHRAQAGPATRVPTTRLRQCLPRSHRGPQHRYDGDASRERALQIRHHRRGA
ncbi:hypothetical protein HPB48_006632 [Haemaphysalis longicornis]|uniref:Uncharacterized protein n=1 Tax=Haemaphysalis longicornis TaxID=44386 RepID=A0A9J6GUX1_HAELO|nr:hypothetical protein HPB48_006632 [Haemaphysalis longicornis]